VEEALPVESVREKLVEGMLRFVMKGILSTCVFIG
jgi:hypothetical protein